MINKEESQENFPAEELSLPIEGQDEGRIEESSEIATDEPGAEKKGKEIIRGLVAKLHFVAHLLAPFLPETSEKIKEYFKAIATTPQNKAVNPANATPRKWCSGLNSFCFMNTMSSTKEDGKRIVPVSYFFITALAVKF